MKKIILLCLIATIFCINIEKAVDYLITNAHITSNIDSKQNVEKALEVAGFNFTKQASSSMYHTNGILKKLKYKEIAKQNNYRKGDLAVTENNSDHPRGHIAMWCGKNWISDFIQESEFISGKYEQKIHYYRYQG